jgi:hypothetical protein
MTNFAVTFSPQLDFPWAQADSQPVSRADDFLEVPMEQAYRSAAKPVLITEQPVPLKFTHAPSPHKKLVQFAGLPKAKRAARKIVVRHKFSNFSNVPLERVKSLPRRAKEKGGEVRPDTKPDWNTDVKTVGVFDTRETKQQPLSVKLALKSHAPQKSKSVTTFETWDDLPVKALPRKSKLGSHVQALPAGEDNLEMKFVSDQTAVIGQLEKHLQAEKEARLAIGKQMQLRMQQIENYRQVNADLMQAKKAFQQKAPKKQTSPRRLQVDAPKTAQKPKISIPRPDDFASRDLEARRLKLGEDEVVHDRRGGNIYEPPTKDEEPILIEVEDRVTPMVLKAPDRVETLRPVPAYQTPPGVRPPPQEKTRSPRHLASGGKSFGLAGLHPMMQTISSALAKAERAERYGVEGTIGLVSRVSARYIAFYADNIADLLVEDLFEDTIRELNRIETYEEARLKREFADEADAYMHSLVHEFQSTAELIMHKYERPLHIPQLEAPSEAIFIEDSQKDWEINLDTETLRSIHEHRRETYSYSQSLNLDGQPLWELYADLGKAYLEVALESAMEELETAASEFAEKVIGQEFL